MRHLPGRRESAIADRHDVEREVISSRRAFEGKVVNVRIDEVQLAAGQESVRRDVVEHPGAAAVIAINDQDEIAFIQQYRHPVRAELWEIPAGLLDVEGEDPKETARRELREEVDLIAGRIDKLMTLALSPGGSDEFVHVYLATDLTPAEKPFDRGEEEAEFELTWVPAKEAIRAIMSGNIANASTVAAVIAGFAKKEQLAAAQQPRPKAAEKPTMRLMVDYSGPALWLLGGDAPEVSDEKLAADLDNWNEHFQNSYDWETGWRTKADADQHFAAAQELLPRVQAHFPNYYVYHDVWETRYQADES
ncbi:hypothetical protein BSZ39_02200 [Bowdeniella nasicola]|uniref:Nudix hydrolase domain-containing protein n=1 Tax=Bowdeniella nasicola TaxID=208480 RepID=A0A1Q5Q540_9ACTO|nr:NUDIX hydrolase [Bowdeniella nasicola]OKL54809.1 hypothetical protein BSZ39_02200 [Bowdeniella nasicola]